MLLAILPTIVLGYFIYKKDIIEKEPINLLAKLFFIGVLLTIPAAFLENFLIGIIDLNIKNIVLKAFVLSFFCIALIEEGYKYLFSYLIGYKNRNFNHIYDSIVYCVFLSLGFATLENILYVLEYGKSTAILRAVTSVPAHVFYGISMGYYMGIAKYYEKKFNKFNELKNKMLSFISPIIIHGIFDFLLLTENEIMITIFFIFVFFMYIIAYFQIKKHSKVMTMLE